MNEYVQGGHSHKHCHHDVCYTQSLSSDTQCLAQAHFPTVRL